MSYKKIIKKTGKLLLYILGSLFILICLFLLFINLPAGKRLVKNNLQSYLQDKLRTKISIGTVNYSLPKSVEINNVYIEDQKKYTLFFGEKISVNISMFKLIWGSIDVKELALKNIFLNVAKGERDSVFNYQFVIDAFSSTNSTPSVGKDTTPLKLNLDHLLLDRVSLKFIDKNGGNDYYAGINSLDATLNKFQPDRIDFGIKEFMASGVTFSATAYKEKIKEPYLPVPDDKIEQQGYGLNITASIFNIRDVNVVIDNQVSGMYYANKVTHLGLRKASFNLSQSIATADELLLDSSFVQYINPKKKAAATASVTTSTATANPWLIKAKKITLTNNRARFDDHNRSASGGFDFSHFSITGLSTDISDLTYSAHKTYALVKQLAFKDTSGFRLDTAHVQFLMTDSILSARNLYVKTPQSLLQHFFELTFDSLSDITKYPRNSSISAMLKNSTMAFNDLYLLVPQLKKSFPPEQFANNKVFFNTELRGNLAQIVLPYLQLVGFSGTNLKAHGSLYNLTDIDRFYYDLYIDQGSFRKSDILKFVPKENQRSLVNLPELISLRGRIRGNTKNLASDIIASGKGMAVNGKFDLKNLSDSKNLQYDFLVRESSFDKRFIMGLIPPGTLPPGINLPEKNYISGSLKGTLDDLVADLKTGGSYGLITVKGFIKNAKDPETANYDLFITTGNYEIGKLISQDSILGKVTGSFTAKGTGFNYKTMRSDITASVKQLQYNKYNYQNAKIAANLNSGIIKSNGIIDDENLTLNYEFNANVQNEYPAIQGFVRVDTARLQPMNLYADTLNFSLTANIKADNVKPRNLDVHTVIDSVKMQIGPGFYVLDSISLVATSAGGRDSINFYAPFAHVNTAGAFDYDKIGNAVVQYVNHYYKISNSAVVQNIPDQQVVFNGTIKKHPLMAAVVPGLKTFDDINFNGSFASANADSALNISLSVPYLAYKDKTVRNGLVNMASKNERLNYSMTFDTLNSASNTFYATGLSGSAANDSVMINFITQDNKAKDWFGLKASFFAKNDNYSFRLTDSLLLNYERWKVAGDNYISYTPQGLIMHNFLISSDTAKILINSRQEIANSPIDIEIDNFNLRTISSIVNHDTIFVSGVMDAKMEVADLNKKLPAFTGNLTVTDLAFMHQPLGTLTASASKQSENNITASLALIGHGSDVVAKGNYYLNSDLNEFDATADIRRLNIATIQAFSGGAINHATGSIHGGITASGKFADPRWKGDLNFDTTKFTLTQLGTAFKVDNQAIIFDYPTVKFNNFTIRDSLNNPLKIDGTVAVNETKSYDINLAVNAKDFIALNAAKKTSSEFYGVAVVDVDVKITGNSVAPNIEGDIAVKDKSNITIIIPERSYGKDEGITIVRFIDRDTFDINPPVAAFVEEKETRPGFAEFLNYNLNVEVQKKAALTIVIDPVTGDEIHVTGAANLNAGVDPGGHIVLSGNYELTGGYYLFNYQFLQRRFMLEAGSTIMFAGEPTQARMDIIAAYIVNTSAKDLLGNEVGSMDPLLANSFDQKVPFKVKLYITGVLSKPTIKFDILLPDDNTVINSDLRTTIENKLAQIRGDESATNKQVFSLLLLGRFVGEQSSDFFKGNGNNFNDLARQSVSQFISSALNEIAGNLVKGIDIDLNLNSYRDYNNGGSAQRTDLNVALSKNFLNDRLTISLGKNFDVQGKATTTQTNSSFIPDVTVGYKLTKDGRYLLKAYRKNQFEVMLDGYVVETGVGFVVTMDYDKFNELFRRNKKK